MYPDNYKMLMKETKELNNWSDVLCLWIRRLNIVKMPVLPKLICESNAIPIKIPARYFGDKDNLTLKFIQKGKRHRRAKTILKKRK